MQSFIYSHNWFHCDSKQYNTTHIDSAVKFYNFLHNCLSCVSDALLHHNNSAHDISWICTFINSFNSPLIMNLCDQI